MSWRTVTRSSKCPICKRGDWCGTTEDGNVTRCMRVQSQHVSGDGWLHFREPRENPNMPPPPIRRTPPPPPVDIDSIWARLQHIYVEDIAADLGVRPTPMVAIGTKYDATVSALAFAMRDHGGDIIGIRLRNAKARKWAVKGSRQGLFFDPKASGDTLLICEGPTDTVAAMSLGYWTLGRPSCRGQDAMVAAYIREHRPQSIVIVLDRDPPKLQGGLRPGREGAMALAKAIRKPVRMVTPPAKDFRAWLAAGATRATADALIGSAMERIWK